MDNAAFLDAVRADASMEYRSRIPSATVAGVQETVRSLMKFRPMYNEFIDALVNRIGLVIARNNSWTNPLAEFKRGMLEFGDTIEEVQVGLLEAHVYDPDREYMEKDLFGTERPEVQSNFHRVNRENFYKVSVNQALLGRAFLESQGLSRFVNQLMEAPTTSDQWDEFLLTCSLFAEYEAQGGFYHVHVPDVRDIGSNEDDAKIALRKMRAMAETMTFLSTKYNAARMPTFASPDELCLFVTPEFNAAIDVEALAGAFHIDKAQMHGRVIPIPADQFRIEGCQAIMTVRDFFVIADQLFETTSQYNPAALQNNYFLHHWQVISASRFVPAVMFTTGADDEVITIQESITSVETPTIEDKDGNAVTDVARGDMIALDSAAVTDPAGGSTAVTWSVSGATSERTYITRSGVLHTGPDETSNSVTVKAQSAYIDPEDPRKAQLSATLVVNVTGPQLTNWPTQGGIVMSLDFGDVVNVPVVAGTTAYTVSVPKGTVIRPDDVIAHVTGSGDVSVTNTGNANDGYVFTVTLDTGVGAPTVYTVTVNEV
jgi:hypothetical protein